MPQISRRDFLLTGAAMAAGRTAFGKAPSKPVVSIVRIKNDRVSMAVEEAIDLLGGIKHVTKGKDRVMLKPNLVAPDPKATTKPEVVRTIAQLMQRAGKEVSIGEGSAAAPKFNLVGFQTFRTRKREILDPMQQYVFDQLGYTDLAKALESFSTAIPGRPDSVASQPGSRCPTILKAHPANSARG